jgi:hypothetical protein
VGYAALSGRDWYAGVVRVVCTKNYLKKIWRNTKILCLVELAYLSYNIIEFKHVEHRRF